MKYSPVVQKIYRQAIQYVRHGWRVLPIQRKSKQPCTAHGFKDATTDIAQVSKWWIELHREANIAIATGKGSRVVVLDLDAWSFKGRVVHAFLP